MTTYDALGLPIFAATDKIAASGDGLREDLNLIGASARTAIVAEGVRAEGAANSYTDGQVGSDRGRLTSIEGVNSTQDGRLTSLEGKVWFKGYLPNGTDLNTYAETGRWAVRLTDDVATIANKPSGAGPGFVELTTSQHGMKVQTWTNYSDGNAWRRVTYSIASNTFTAWGAVDVDAKAYADGRFAPFWKAGTAYTAGQRVLAPNGDVVSAKVAFTSGTAYNAANWNASSQDARTAALESKAGLSDLVTNGSFRDGLTGWTNTGAWVVQTSANGVTSYARTMSGSDGAFAQSITIPAALIGKTLRLKVLAMTTSTGTLVTSVVTTAGTTSLNHTLTTAYVERTLDVPIPAAQGTTAITLNVGRYTGTVYMTAIRLEAL